MEYRLAMGLLTVVLLVAAVTDWRYGKVYNGLTYPAIAAGFLLWAVVGWFHAGWSGAWSGLEGASVGLIVAFVPFTIIFASGGIGGGDVKLFTALGAISASWQCVFAAAFYSFIIAAVMALGLVAWRGRLRHTLANIITAAIMRSAKTKPTLPTDSPRVPFAVAVAGGGILAGAEILLGLNTPWAAFVKP